MAESITPEPIQEPVSVDDNAGTLTVDNAALSVTGGGVEASALRVTVASDSTGVVSVDDNGGSLTVDGTVTANLAAGTNNIGDVDVLTVPAPLSTTGGGTEATALRVTVANDSTGLLSVDDNGGSLTVDNATISVVGGGTEATAQRVTIANDSTGVLSVDDNGGALTVDQATAANLNAQVVGAVAHDAAASGNPLLNAGSHETIADSAPTNRLASVTDGDVQRFSTTDGALFVIPTGPQSWQTVNLGTLTGATVKAAPGAGLSLYVTGMQFSIGAATASSIKLTISGGADMVGPHYLEAINGRGVAFVFPTPLKVTANTALLATSTGAATATLNVQGFTAPG